MSERHTGIAEFNPVARLRLLTSKLTALFRLTFAVLLAGVGLGANADFNEGIAAYERGDYATALRAWQPLAEQGDAEAQSMLGQMYDEGEGVPQDYEAAAQWYRRAAERGDAEAQFNLGVMYYDGERVLQDYKAAIQWFRRAAEQGHAKAQVSLGGMYSLGKGVPENYVYAYMWVSIAASFGNKYVVELRNLLRNLVKEGMTPSQIAEAQKLARECVRKAYKDC